MLLVYKLDSILKFELFNGIMVTILDSMTSCCSDDCYDGLSVHIEATNAD